MYTYIYIVYVYTNVRTHALPVEYLYLYLSLSCIDMCRYIDMSTYMCAHMPFLWNININISHQHDLRK